MTLEVTAQLRYYRMGPRKMRLLVDLVRGKRAERALSIFSVINKRGALPLRKLLASAIANAKHNHSLVSENLYIKSMTVDGGPVLKRWMPKAHGRATPVRERTSHIKLTLGVLEKKEKKTKKEEVKK
ncbi:MAG: 50S ribosomal protein L22 [Candidatus Magasanikbacteria bacterium]|nr:50S ribosomal protein L22 [Candidatus Magasanikbacteria bacterium]